MNTSPAPANVPEFAPATQSQPLNQSELLALILSEPNLSLPDIAARVGISLLDLCDWLNHPEQQHAMAAFSAACRARAQALADAHLPDLMDKLSWLVNAALNDIHHMLSSDPDPRSAAAAARSVESTRKCIAALLRFGTKPAAKRSPQPAFQPAEPKAPPGITLPMEPILERQMPTSDGKPVCDIRKRHNICCSKKARKKELNDNKPAETPQDYTWHHHEDGEAMILVKEKEHTELQHTGGHALEGKNSDSNETALC